MTEIKSLKFTKAKILETIKSRSRPDRKYKHIQLVYGKRHFDGKLLYTDFPREVKVDRYYIDGDYVYFSVVNVASCTNYIDRTNTTYNDGIGYNSAFVGMSWHGQHNLERHGHDWNGQWLPWYKLKILDIKRNKIITKKCVFIVDKPKTN